MTRVFLAHFIALTLFLLSACTTLTSQYEQPQLSITSFTLLPSNQGLTPQFKVGLRIVNPNRQALPLKGMSYSIEVNGYRILTGAEPKLPAIKGFETETITVIATPDLLGSARLIKHVLSNKNNQTLSYLFKAKIDVGTLMPYITIEEKGSFTVN
jgi:LEA14-like dessication related protein